MPEFIQMKHQFSALDQDIFTKPGTDDQLKESARVIEKVYLQTLQLVGNANGRQPYNFVMTKDWIFVVMRRQPDLNGLHVNSLGYLGLIFAKNEASMQVVQDTKPIDLLKALAVPMQQQELYHNLNSLRN